MTAEGTACNGAGEAPKAEFAAEKVAVAAAAPEERAPGEKEGEEVGGPFVIVNGDSDELSDRGSDLDKALDEDSPSEEDDVPGSNAALDAAAGGDHGAATEEVGAPGAAPAASLADGRDRAAEGSEVGANEGKGERSADLVAEVVQQEATGGEQGGADTLPASGSDRAATGADSDAPAVDSKVDGKEGIREESAATGFPELVVHEAATAEQGGEDAAAESYGHDDALRNAESGSAAMESQVYMEDIKDDQSAAADVEPVELGTGGQGALMANGHLCSDMKADSFEASTEPESHADESKPEQNVTDVAELVEQDAASEEQDGTDALENNGHIQVAMSADSCLVATESMVHANEMKGKESVQQEEEAPTTEVKVLEGVVQAVGRNCAGSVEEPIEEEVDAHGDSYVGGRADASRVPEAVIEEVEGEATCGILQMEEKMDKGGEESLCNDCTAGIACCNEEVEHPLEEGINVAAPDVGELEEVTENRSGEIVQGDESVKDEVSICILHSLKPESDTCVESTREHKGQLQVSTGVETASDSILKADNVVEVNTAAPLLSQQICDSAESVEHEQLEAPSFGEASEMENDVAEAEPKKDVETEVVDAVPLEASDVAEAEPNKVVGMKVVNAVPLEAADVADAEPNKDVEMDVVDAVPLEAADVEEAERKKDVEMEVVGAVPLQAAAASSFHNEPRSTDLVDGDSIRNFSPPATELESCDHIHTTDSRPREISDITVDQLLSGTSLEHETTVADESKLTSEADGSQEKTSDTAVDQGEPIALNIDELAVVDDVQPYSAKGSESAGFDKGGDISVKNESSDIVGDIKSREDQSEICNASTPCDDICSENVNACTKSSDEVETKCLEALAPSSVDTVVPAEHKDDDELACDEETKIVEDSSELHGDIDKSNTGDAQVIKQRRVFMIKVPKSSGEDLWARIQVAHAHLDQLTQERDAINSRRQKQKAVCDQYREKLEAARREEREARAAHGDKKNDLNSVRSMIGKLNQANSIEEIDEMIATKEKIMQHETISLKEEKLLIREINELKVQRKQLCSNMGSKAEINEAFDQKDHIHERHKTLKKDSDVLLTNLKSLEENTRKIQKSFEDERIVLRKLNEEYRVANERRQKAYSDWSDMKAEPYKRNQYFFMYKDDQKIAGEYVLSGDMYGLQLHCDNQVEKIMKVWNKNDDFRKRYVESNKISTLRRLGTHDGRRLGPDEDPPVIPSRRPSNPPSSLTVSSSDVPISTSVAASVNSIPVSVHVKEDSFPVLPSPQISKRSKSKASGSSAQNEKIAVTVSEREDVKQTEEEKAHLMEEELELARKAEELARKEEKLREERAAAEKERLRLEQKAKAKEAEERKKRKAEKAQERAEFKARKEAEKKKKAKKDKKKGPGDSSVIDGNAAALATADTDSNASDNPRDVEVPQQTASKRLSRPAVAMKQLNRVQPMPAPLRNRGKRKMRQYILIAAAVLSVLALFVAGNYIPKLKSLHF